MTTKTEETPKLQENPKKLFSEARGKYIYLDETKAFFFDFPIRCTLAENYAIISHMKDEIWKALEEERKRESEKKETNENKKVN